MGSSSNAETRTFRTRYSLGLSFSLLRSILPVAPRSIRSHNGPIHDEPVSINPTRRFGWRSNTPPINITAKKFSIGWYTGVTNWLGCSAASHTSDLRYPIHEGG